MNTLSARFRTSLLLALPTVLAACGAATTPTAPTATLTVNVVGVPAALVFVSGTGATPLSGDVIGSKTFTSLPRGLYTIRAAAIDGYTTPAAQQADLSGGDHTVNLAYVKVDRAALTLSVKGVDRASVTVTSGSTVLFDGAVLGEKIITDLPRTKVTVTPQVIDGKFEPEPTVVDLAGGTGTTVLTYLDGGIPARHVRGTLAPWTGVSGKSISSSPYPQGAVVSADGSFDLMLPGSPNPFDLSPLRTLGCGGLTVSGDGNFHAIDSVYSISGDVSAPYSAYGIAVERPTDVTVKSGVGSVTLTRIYADRPGTATGTTTCGPITDTFDLRLRTGWNIARVRIDQLDANGRPTAFTYTTAPVVSASTFVFTKATGSFNVSLDSPYQSVNVTAGGSATVGATVSTVNDFSGTVIVDYVDGAGQPVPGVTVSPASFELQADGTVSAASTGGLGAQSLRALGVSRTFTISASADAERGTRSGTLRFRSGAVTSTPGLYVNVQRPGFNLSMYNYGATGTWSLGPGEPVQNGYGSISGIDGFQGKVTLTIEGAPEGVTFSAPPVDVVWSYGSFTPALTAALGTKPGTYAAKLVGTSGSIRAEQPFTLEVLAPTVTPTITPKSVYQNEESTSVVTLRSRYGYSGRVTLSVENLPRGVTVQGDPAVTLPVGAEAAYNLVLVGAADAFVGTTDVILVATTGDVSTRTPFKLTSHRQRTATGTTTLGKPVIDGAGHPWIYDSAGGKLVKVVPGGTNVSVTVTGTVNTLVAGGDGHLWYTTSTYNNSSPYGYISTVSRVNRDTLNVTSWTLPTYASSIAVDASARVFYLASSGSWNTPTTLSRFDTSTATNRVLDSTLTYSTDRPLKLGSDGHVYTLTTSSSVTSVTKVNAETGATTTGTVPGLSGISVFQPGADVIWVFGFTNSGTRLAMYTLGANSATYYPLPDTGYFCYSCNVRDTFFDASGKLWADTGDRAMLFDPATGTWTIYSTNTSDTDSYWATSSTGAAPAAGGGLWYSWTVNQKGYVSKLVP